MWTRAGDSQLAQPEGGRAAAHGPKHLADPKPLWDPAVADFPPSYPHIFQFSVPRVSCGSAMLCVPLVGGRLCLSAVGHVLSAFHTWQARAVKVSLHPNLQTKLDTKCG